jgi:hypothetical protein
VSSELQQCLRGHLEALARQGKTISYRQLAVLAEIPEPRVIGRLASLLEAIIREDHAVGIAASVASLVVSQTKPAIPRAGYFMLLRELGVYNGSDEGAAAEIFHAACVEQLFGTFKR